MANHGDQTINSATKIKDEEARTPSTGRTEVNGRTLGTGQKAARGLELPPLGSPGGINKVDSQ